MSQSQDREDGSLSTGPNSLRKLAIIADDLTGACDAGIAFCRVSSDVYVSLEGTSLPSGVFAVSTGTRDIAPAESERRIEALLEQLRPGSLVFKKVDSVLRGNSVREIAATIRAFPAQLVIVAPAYPELGRRQHQGLLEITDVTGTRSVALAEALLEEGCAARVLAAGASTLDLHSLLEGTQVLLCDALTQSDLDILVQEIRNLGVHTLWIGSGGLAHALAASYHPVALRPDAGVRRGHPVFLIGSDHAVTQAQVAELDRSIRSASSRYADEVPGARRILLPVGPPSVREARLREAFAEVQPEETSCLFMTGGDTALMICRFLGITGLRLVREFATGVPLTLAEGGPFADTTVILKSGGFGDRNLLCRIHDVYTRKEPAFV